MSDDEADPELLALLAKSLGLTDSNSKRSPVITVLKDAEYIYDNSTDIAIDMRGTKAAAGHIWSSIQDKGYSTRDWSKHELHPKTKDESTVNFIFLMDLLNFSFWPNSEDPKEGFAIEYLGKRRTGYWSLVACIQRALDQGVPITDPSYWVNESECTDDVLKRVFKSDTTVEIPLLEDRLYCVREAGYVLRDRFGGSFINCILDAAGSAASLVNILVDYFPCFDDRHRFEGQIVCLHKRPQILVADLWACFEGEGYGSFSDVDQITMFAGKPKIKSRKRSKTFILMLLKTIGSLRCSIRCHASHLAHLLTRTFDNARSLRVVIIGRFSYVAVVSGVSS